MSEMILKGEKKPVECIECPCYDNRSDRCCATMMFVKSKTPPEWCPASGIEGSHGRLIDADDLLHRIQESENYLSPAILAYIETAETIVEATGDHGYTEEIQNDSMS